VYKTNPHTLEELRNNIHHEISAISGEELQRVNTVFYRYNECIQSGRQYFQHCCSTGESLFHFLKVILTAAVYHRATTDCYPCTDAASWGLTGCGFSFKQ
jgi:hypothetical protein